uniref:glutathione transferase n=1 Tax=Acrobeloides nanus TaxID=290746 RepID=A0A914EBX8_9BILA
MVHYKLQYFDLRGLGEPIRLILHYVGQDFEEERLDYFSDEWLEFKEKTPYGHLPILLVDGVPIAECRAIGRYLGKKFNLLGKTDLEAAQLDSIADFFLEFFMEARPYLFVLFGLPYKENDKEKLYNELWVPKSAETFPRLEKILKESGSGFLSKDGISWVDFFVAALNYTINKNLPETFRNFPEIKKHVEKIHGLPELQEYLGKRKVTDL